MAWRVDSTRDRHGVITQHRNGEGTHGERHELNVGHDDGEEMYVGLYDPKDGKRGDYTRLSHTPGFPFAWVTTGFAATREQVAAPSETLQQLIAQHHQHPDQWPILLDKLQEEYPQLHEAIEAHHAARRSSDAAQYARSFAESIAAKPLPHLTADLIDAAKLR